MKYNYIVGSFTKPRICAFLQNPILAGHEIRQSNATGQETSHAISNGKLFYVTFQELVLVFVKITSFKTWDMQIQ